MRIAQQSAMNAPPRRDAYEEGLKLSARGQHVQAIEQFEQALAKAPNDTRVLFALGNTARDLSMEDAAERFYRQVLTHEPDRLEALINLANLLRKRGMFEAAQAILAPALSHDPASAELWLTLGSIHRETGERTRAMAHYRQALVLHPDYAPALGNLADLLADDGDVEEALALYDRVLRQEKHHAQARINRAVLHLLRGNLKDGWRDYAARLNISGKLPAPDHKLERWNGDSLKRQRLLITAEQGIGDQIMFASMIPDLMVRATQEGGHLILECEPRLVTLFERSFPGVTIKPWDAETRGGITRTRYDWLKSAGGATRAVEMGSLPRQLRSKIESFPNPNTYLRPDSREITRWRNDLGTSPKIGICWRSGKTGGHRSLQYAPLEVWADFVRALPATFVCVQYDAAPEEIAHLEALSGKNITVPAGIDQKNEIDRACALFASLDAVVSAPTAVSWLAAAAGVPTYKILYDTSWTSFGETYEPFGPACTCVMPRQRGDWKDCFAATETSFNSRFAKD
jgi:tetratricopeptide (TPR) repeat protein